MSGSKNIKANKMLTPMVTILVKLSNEALYIICGLLFFCLAFGVWCLVLEVWFVVETSCYSAFSM